KIERKFRQNSKQLGGRIWSQCVCQAPRTVLSCSTVLQRAHFVRRSVKKNIFLLLMVISLATMGVDTVHIQLTQEKGWLNTSRSLTVSDLKERILLVDFWTFCCINCMHIIPDLQKLESEFGADLTVLGVHSAKFLNEK